MADVVVPVLQATGRHHVDWHAEQRFELLADVQQIEERAARLELHEEVDVARGTLVTSSD